MEIIINKIKDTIVYIFNYLYTLIKNLQEKYDNHMKIKDEEIERSKSSYYYKLIVLFKKYRKIIAIVSLLLLLLSYMNYSMDYGNCEYKNIQDGGGVKSGFMSAYRETGKTLNEGRATAKKISAKATAAKDAIMRQPITGAALRKTGKAYGKGKDMAVAGIGKFKAMSGAIYQALFQIALVIIVFISFGPIVVFAIVFIICYALMKEKITAVKDF